MYYLYLSIAGIFLLAIGCFVAIRFLPAKRVQRPPLESIGFQLHQQVSGVVYKNMLHALSINAGIYGYALMSATGDQAVDYDLPIALKLEMQKTLKKQFEEFHEVRHVPNVVWTECTPSTLDEILRLLAKSGMVFRPVSPSAANQIKQLEALQRKGRVMQQVTPSVAANSYQVVDQMLESGGQS